MKRYIRSTIKDDNTIRVTMYLEPVFYEDSEIFTAVSYDPKVHRYNTDVNPQRVLNGPLNEKGEQLQPPISHEYEEFINDCKWLVKELGFHVLSEYRSQDSEKSEYVIVYGLKDIKCGTIIYDLRISDHFLENLKFPDQIKSQIVELLKVENVLDGDATYAGIEFRVEQVVVGGVKNDSWNDAFHRLYNILKKMKSTIQIRIQRDK